MVKRLDGAVASDNIALPVGLDVDASPRDRRTNAATGASAASVRAVSAQLVTFYFRAPVKAFFRTRFEWVTLLIVPLTFTNDSPSYTAYARAINPLAQAGGGWTWRTSSPALLAHAIREHGWSFIPNQVLPPMLANVSVGAILYTTYLQTLGVLHEPASRSSKRVFPPPAVSSTLTAGFVAGAVQSIVSAPLDALQVRFKASDMLEGKYKTMWQYSRHKLAEIGPRGVFAGWSLSFAKDACGSALFFATFETIKSQAYYAFVRRWYADYKPMLWSADAQADATGRLVINPHYLMEPSFLLAAGMGAAFTQQLVQHPLQTIQDIHYTRLESMDLANKLEETRKSAMRVYYHAYEQTFAQCKALALKAGGWRRWLYQNFVWSTIRQVPSTSAGLIVFEIVRRRYAFDDEEVRITKDGYDILLR